LINVAREDRDGCADAAESLISIACAAGSVVLDIELGLLFCARPTLAVKHLTSLSKLSNGTIPQGPRALRAQAFVGALEKYVLGGGLCSPAQACAAVLSYVEILLGQVEGYHRKEAVAHVSEAGAVARLLDFVDFVGGTRCTMSDTLLAFAVIDAVDNLAIVEEMAAGSHLTPVEVSSENPDGGCDNASAISIIHCCTFRLLAANLALSVNSRDPADAVPEKTLERCRVLFNSVLENSAESSYFGEMGACNRNEIRELVLVAYDVGGESFYKNSLAMLKVAKTLLQNMQSIDNAHPSSTNKSKTAGIAVAVLSLLARPSILLPLLLKKREDIGEDLKDIVDIVHQIRFRNVGRDACIDSADDMCASSNKGCLNAACWDWSLCHNQSIELSQNGRRVSKSNSSPDYSCAMSSEAFNDGVHIWEIIFETTGSTWVGISDETAKDRLGSSPSLKYGVTLHNTGAWKFFGDINSTKSDTAPFSNGSVIKAQLDCELCTLDMWVDGVHKLSVTNLQPIAYHAYVCMDNQGECFQLLSASKQESIARCQTISEAVHMLSSSLINLETGIQGNPIAKGRNDGYGQLVIDLFSARMKEIAADLGKGAISPEQVSQTIEKAANNSCFDEVFALARQISCSPYLSGELRSLSNMIQMVYAFSMQIRIPSEHWLEFYMKDLVSAIGPRLKTFVWGELLAGDTEPETEDWLKSALFSRGMLATPSNLILLLVPEDSDLRRRLGIPIAEQVAAPAGDQGNADHCVALVGKRKHSDLNSNMTQQGLSIDKNGVEPMRSQSSTGFEVHDLPLAGAVFDNMIQPRVAVHLSPYLDFLERNVIIALLYHLGILEAILHSGAQQPEEIIHFCQVMHFYSFCFRYDTPYCNSYGYPDSRM
jgi:hypothetical protein